MYSYLTNAAVYFLPIYFQSIKEVSAAVSGIWTLPLMLSMVLASIIGGIATSKVGYYTPFCHRRILHHDHRSRASHYLAGRYW